MMCRRRSPPLLLAALCVLAAALPVVLGAPNAAAADPAVDPAGAADAASPAAAPDLTEPAAPAKVTAPDEPVKPADSASGAEGTLRAGGDTAAGPSIRIGLAHTPRATITLSGPFQVSASPPADLPALYEGSLEVAPDPDQTDGLLLKLDDGRRYRAVQWDFTYAGSGEFYYQSLPYRGSLRLLRQGDSVIVINVIPLEWYLLGVVPREMPSDWHLEALKAQAVAARTYAWANRSRFGAFGYDLTADDRSQVYGGKLAERERVSAAVFATSGEILRYHGSEIATYYSSSNGGYTAAPGEVWGGSAGYLAAQPDPYDAAESPFMNWNRTLSAEEIRTLSKGGELLDVIVRQRGPSGRVLQLDVVTDRGVYSYWREEIRTVLGARSTLLDVAVRRGGAAAVWVQGRARSASSYPAAALTRSGVVASVAAAPTLLGRRGTAVLAAPAASVEVTGSGWGHGVGLSQWGARGRAEAGQDYRTILQFYYPGANLETLIAAAAKEGEHENPEEPAVRTRSVAHAGAGADL